MLANDGDAPIRATLQQLPAEGGEAASPVTDHDPAGAHRDPPRSWLGTDPTAAVFVTADGDLVVVSAGTVGKDQTNGYAMGLGVPAPPAVSQAP